MSGKKYATTDPDVIRRWAEERHGTPVLFHEIDPDSNEQWPGFAFPGYDQPNSYEEVTWQELFNKRAEDRLVFLYQEMTETGELSLYNRFVNQQLAKEAIATAEHERDVPRGPSALDQTNPQQSPLATK